MGTKFSDLYYPTISTQRAIVLTVLTITPFMVLEVTGLPGVAYLLGSAPVSSSLLMILAAMVATLTVFLLAATGGPIDLVTGHGRLGRLSIEQTLTNWLCEIVKHVLNALQWQCTNRPSAAGPPATGEIPHPISFLPFQGIRQLCHQWMPGTCPIVIYHPLPLPSLGGYDLGQRNGLVDSVDPHLVVSLITLQFRC